MATAAFPDSAEREKPPCAFATPRSNYRRDALITAVVLTGILFPLLLILLGLSWLALVDSSTLWMTLNVFLQAGSGG